MDQSRSKLYFNILLMAVIMFAISVSAAPCEAAKLRIRHAMAEGEITYLFSESKISKRVLKKYAAIHPSAYNPDLLLAQPLEQCKAKDPKYYQPCGSRDIHAKNFYKNANVNIRLAKRSQRYLKSLVEIRELQPIVNHFKSSLSFSIWLNENKLKFFKSWDIAHLKKRYQRINPLKICPEVIKEIDKSDSNDEKYRLTNYEWHNALNAEFWKKDRDKYFNRVWQSFLKKYGIRESIQYSEP